MLSGGAYVAALVGERPGTAGRALPVRVGDPSGGEAREQLAQIAATHDQVIEVGSGRGVINQISVQMTGADCERIAALTVERWGSATDILRARVWSDPDAGRRATFSTSRDIQPNEPERCALSFERFVPVAEWIDRELPFDWIGKTTAELAALDAGREPTPIEPPIGPGAAGGRGPSVFNLVLHDNRVAGLVVSVVVDEPGARTVTQRLKRRPASPPVKVDNRFGELTITIGEHD